MKTEKLFLTALAIAMMVGACGTPPTPIPAQEFICKGATVMVNPESGVCEARFESISIPDVNDNESGGVIIGPVLLPIEDAIEKGELLELVAMSKNGKIPVLVRTVIMGFKPVDLKAYFKGFKTVNGEEMLDLETDDSRFDKSNGAAGGMSGSSVIIEGRLAGLLSRAFWGQIKSPFSFFATPIKDVLKVGELAVLPMQCTKDRPASGLIVVVGAAAEKFGPLMDRLPIANEGLFSKMALGGEGAGGSSLIETEALVVGSMVAINIVSGPLVQSAAMCTVGAVDGPRIWACGHPIFGVGPVEFPYSGGYVFGMRNGSKLAVPAGKNKGTIYEDRKKAIAGEEGRQAKGIISVTTSIGTEGGTLTAYPEHLVAPITFRGEYYTSAFDVALVAAASFIAANDTDTAGSAIVKFAATVAKVNKEDATEKVLVATRTNAVSSSTSLVEEIFFQLADDLREVFKMGAPIEKVEISIVQSKVERSFEIVDVELPPKAPPIMAGESFTAVVSYYEDGKKPTEKKLNVIIEVPADFPAGEAYLTVRRAPQVKADPEPVDLAGRVEEFNKKPANTFLQVKLTNQDWPEDGSEPASAETIVDTGKYITRWHEAYLRVKVGAPTPSTDGGMPADGGSELDGGTLDAGTP